MSDRYPGGIITKTPVTPAGPYAEGSAPGVWTLEQQAYWQAQGLWPSASNPTPNDPYFQYVTSLLHGDGTNGGQNNTFLDSSTNAFTITRNGNTTQGSFSPYGSNWGNYFNGTNSYLSVADNTGLQLGTGDFTIEMFVYLNDISVDYGGRIFALETFGNGYANILTYREGSNLKFLTSSSGSSWDVNETFGAVTLGSWNHIAVSRSGNTFTGYLNGVQTFTTSNSTNLSNTGSGAKIAQDVGEYFSGYLSNLRLIKGSAIYSGSTITVPTSQLTAVSGTSLLTCQSNRFIDNSSNNATITASGTPQVTRFSPFAPTYATQYSASTIGGSGYFDGSGDYLSIPSSSSFDFYNTSFTIECWYYPKDSGTQRELSYGSGDSGNLQYLSNKTIQGYFGGSGYLTGTIPLVVNQWNHIAVSASGSTASLFINGVRDVQNTSFSPTNTGNQGYYIGRPSATEPLGYISDFRVVRGSTVYSPSSTTITIPTAPLTAITNTSLLCNMTNGAIYDNAMIPDYETVGNAQISTSVKKYGTGSLSLSASGNTLQTKASIQDTNVGAGNFTIEGWVYFTTVQGAGDGNGVFQMSSTAGGFVGNQTNNLALGASEGTGWQIYAKNTYTVGTMKISSGTWYHFALCRAGSVTKLFINGTVLITLTGDTTTYNTPYVGLGSIYDATSYPTRGYIDDFRITKGYARYWENFTPPAAAFPNFGGALTVPTQDPQFNYTTMLLPGNGTNGAQNNTFLDSSTNAFTITRNGNTTQGTFSPFSQTGWSQYFDGTSYLTTASNSAFGTGTGDFTVEAWVYPTQLRGGSGENNIIGVGVSNGWLLGYFGSSIYLASNQNGYTVQKTFTLSLNTWTHIAAVRSGSTATIYVNGTSIGSGTYSTNCPTGYCVIGGDGLNGTNRCMYGYVSNARFNNTVLYTSNFTPSTTPLTAVSGTQILSAQSNRFIDNSTNAFALTATGSPSVQAFSPFSPTAAYSASTVGGSGYFDGSGDYLSLPNNSAFAIGTNDFTFETWAYFTSTPNTQIFCTNDGYGTDSPYGYYYFSYESGAFWSWGGGGGGNTGVSASYTMPLNQWVHLVAVRSGTSHSIFVNGTRIGNATNQQSYTGGTSPLIGARVNYITGYLSSTRFVNGTAVYNPSSSTLTVPTAPLTNVTNTKLLANFTNAGITDATAKNNLETLGNTQISTTQSKFGESSIAFDGSGDYMYVPSSPMNALGSGDFTIEFWIYSTDFSAIQYVLDARTSSTDIVPTLRFGTDRRLNFFLNGNAEITTDPISANTWTHIAFNKFSGSTKIFINGVQSGATYSDTNTYIQTPWYFGKQYNSNNYYLFGYLDDFRVTRGYARYTGNFTPPTQAFQLY